jgi:outer membrane biosynthesis protein TonB
MFCNMNQGITWDVSNRELAYGILHQYSQLIDFNAMTLVPADVRANVTLPTAILMQYQASWDDLCSTLEDRVVLAPKVVVQEAPVQTVVNSTPVPAPVEQPAPKQEVKPVVQEKAPEKPAEEEQELSPLEKKLLEIRKRSEARDAEINKKSKEAAAKPATSTSVTEKKDEAAAANAILDEYDV